MDSEKAKLFVSIFSMILGAYLAGGFLWETGKLFLGALNIYQSVRRVWD